MSLSMEGRSAGRSTLRLGKLKGTLYVQDKGIPTGTWVLFGQPPLLECIISSGVIVDREIWA